MVHGFAVRILALETTETIGSVAAASDDKLLAELQLNPQQRSAASLAPALQDLLKMVGWRPGDVQLVAVTIGPGSFTGLRVGVTTAKTFAYAVGAEVLGVDTLQAIANGLPGETPGTVPIFGTEGLKNGTVPLIATHACRSPWTPSGETWSPSAFARDAAGWFQPAGPQELLAIDAWLAGLTPGTAGRRPGFGKAFGPSARGRVGRGGPLLASPGRRRGPAGGVALCGRPPRRRLVAFSPLLPPQCRGRKMGQNKDEG